MIYLNQNLSLQNINDMVVEDHIKKLPSTKIHGSPIVLVSSLWNFFLYVVQQQFMDQKSFPLPLHHHQWLSWVFLGLLITTSLILWITFNCYNYQVVFSLPNYSLYQVAFGWLRILICYNKWFLVYHEPSTIKLWGYTCFIMAHNYCIIIDSSICKNLLSYIFQRG